MYSRFTLLNALSRYDDLKFDRFRLLSDGSIDLSIMDRKMLLYRHFEAGILYLGSHMADDDLSMPFLLSP